MNFRDEACLCALQGTMPKSSLIVLFSSSFIPKSLLEWMIYSSSATPPLLGYLADERSCRSILREEKAAGLAYCRLRHQQKGYLLYAFVCQGSPVLLFTARITLRQTYTCVRNLIIGGLSFATSGAKAMHNASTAQELVIVSPHASRFEFRVSHSLIF